MNIKPSAAIRQNYNEIASICKTTGEPVYLTKNGEGDLVVMDIDAFTRREKMLRLREELLTVEEERLHGEPDYTVDEVASMMEQAIREVRHAGAGGDLPGSRVKTGIQTAFQPCGLCRTTGRAVCTSVGRRLSRGGCLSEQISLSESGAAF